MKEEGEGGDWVDICSVGEEKARDDVFEMRMHCGSISQEADGVES